MKEIKRERGKIQSELLVIGEAGGMGARGSERGRRAQRKCTILGKMNKETEKLRNHSKSIDNGNLRQYTRKIRNNLGILPPFI